ncbi:MAG: TetR/AcrR family transcriptional regulator C-terminal ligand-binding domain-containing protein [Jatrophihabitans sp.]
MEARSGNKPPAGARPGRKRSEDSRTAIVSAAWELFSEVGYAELSTRTIAARAGCGRQTIFRWWPSTADVLLEALSTKAETHVSIADQGDLTVELRAFLEDSFALSHRSGVAELLCALMAQAQTDVEFGKRFHDSFLAVRRAALGGVFQRAIDCGQLSHQLRTETMLDIVFGVIWYRMLATREPLDDTLVNELISLLVASPGPENDQPHERRTDHLDHRATDGLRRAPAAHLAAEGARLVLHGRDQDKLDDLGSGLTAHSPQTSGLSSSSSTLAVPRALTGDDRRRPLLLRPQTNTSRTSTQPQADWTYDCCS